MLEIVFTAMSGLHAAHIVELSLAWLALCCVCWKAAACQYSFSSIDL
jgi:hypothetical protein